MKTMHSIEPGQQVMFGRHFLRSIGCYTGDICFAKGKVTAIRAGHSGVQLADVEWDKPDLPCTVLACNLVPKTRIHLESQ